LIKWNLLLAAKILQAHAVKKKHAVKVIVVVLTNAPVLIASALPLLNRVHAVEVPLKKSNHAVEEPPRISHVVPTDAPALIASAVPTAAQKEKLKLRLLDAVQMVALVLIANVDLNAPRIKLLE
jgi:hypothetical protein